MHEQSQRDVSGGDVRRRDFVRNLSLFPLANSSIKVRGSHPSKQQDVKKIPPYLRDPGQERRKLANMGR